MCVNGAGHCTVPGPHGGRAVASGFAWPGGSEKQMTDQFSEAPKKESEWWASRCGAAPQSPGLGVAGVPFNMARFAQDTSSL